MTGSQRALTGKRKCSSSAEIYVCVLRTPAFFSFSKFQSVTHEGVGKDGKGEGEEKEQL